MLRDCGAGPFMVSALFISALLTGCSNKTTSAPQSSQNIFDDVTTAAGLSYVWEQPKGKSPLTILEKIGNGAAFFDFDQDLYDKKITIEMIDFIREELKFESVESLKNQLHKDKQICKNYINNSKFNIVE